MELLFSFAQHPRTGPVVTKHVHHIDSSKSLATCGDDETVVSMEPQDCTDVLKDVVLHGGCITCVHADVESGRVVQLHLLIDKKRFEKCIIDGGFPEEEHLIALAKSVWREARTPTHHMPFSSWYVDFDKRQWNDAFPLFEHQVQTLGWLKHVEANGPNTICYPGNLRVTDRWFLDTECECFTQNPSIREAHLVGGICADGTGTGKTATFLALIADSVHRPPPDPLPQMGFYRTGASLVIVPRNLVSQWQAELHKFVKNVKVHVLGTVRDIRAMDFILGQDVILTTMQFLRASKYVDTVETALGCKLRSRASLSAWARRKGQTTCVLEAIEWRRIIVDEVHDVLANPREIRHLRFMNCHTLWGMTATPVLDTDQAQQLYMFLEREKNHHPQLLSQLIAEGVKCHATQTYQPASLVRVIMDDPPSMIDTSMRDFVEKCTFMDVTEEEEDEQTLRDHFAKQHENDEVNLNARLISLDKTILFLRQSIKQCGEGNDSVAYSQREDLERALRLHKETEQNLNFITHSQTFVRDRLRALTEQQETCSICMERVCGVILPCAHLFCSTCIRNHLRSSEQCPVCRHPTTAAQLKGIPIINNIGVKMAQIGRLVLKLNTESIILFVQWKSMLKATKTFLQSIGAVVCTLEGSSTRRACTLTEFSKRPSILLLCLEESFAGLHLAHVSHVIFAHAIVGDLETVKRLETQAIARCVRHGQKENVHIYSFVVANTEEERLWHATRG